VFPLLLKPWKNGNSAATPHVSFVEIAPHGFRVFKEAEQGKEAQ